MRHATHVIVTIAAFMAISAAGAAVTAVDIADAIPIAWETAGKPAVNSMNRCTGQQSSEAFGAFATALLDILPQGSSITDVAWVNVASYCGFTLTVPFDGEPTLLPGHTAFSPSAMSPARTRHVQGTIVVGAAGTFAVEFRSTEGTNASIAHTVVNGPTIVGGEEQTGCFTPSLQTFRGPSPCDQTRGHGRFEGDAPVDPPGQGRSGDAPGRNR